MSREAFGPQKLLTPAEVAKLFQVDPKTITRWARAGKLPVMRTLGGHRRYRWADIQPHLQMRTEGGDDASPQDPIPGAES